ILSAYGEAEHTPSPEPAGVVLVGAAGVGRTRLAKEALARLAERGCQTAWVSGTHSAASIPFGAMAHLLPCRAQVGPAEALRSFVAGFGGRPRPVLAVDDVHLLDDASAALVHHAAVHGHVFVLLTAQSGATTPDAVTALWAGEAVRRIDLTDLDEAGAAEL